MCVHWPRSIIHNTTPRIVPDNPCRMTIPVLYAFHRISVVFAYAFLAAAAVNNSGLISL
jgi:hypothetical protein